MKFYALIFFLAIAQLASAQRGKKNVEPIDTMVPYIRSCAELEGAERHDCSVAEYGKRLVNQLDRSSELKDKYPDAYFDFSLNINGDGSMGDLIVDEVSKGKVSEALIAAHELIKDDLNWSNPKGKDQIVKGEKIYINSGSGIPYLVQAKQILCGKVKSPKKYYCNAQKMEEVLAGAFDINDHCGNNEKRRKKYKVDEIFVEFVPEKITGEEGEPESAYFKAKEIAPLSRWIGSFEDKGILEFTIIPKDEKRREKTIFVLLNHSI